MMLRTAIRLIIALLLLTHWGVSAADPVYFVGKRYEQAEETVKAAGLDCDCIIALGSDALTPAIDYARSHPGLPLFTAFISASKLNEDIESYPQLPITGLYAEPAPAKQVRLGQLLTGRKRVSVFYSDRSDYLKDQLQDNQLIKTQKAQIRKALSRLQHVDAVVAIPDATIWNKQSFKTAALSLYRQNKALIGFSQTLVKAGAVASLYYEDADYLNEFIAMIQQHTDQAPLPKPRYPTRYQIAINDKVAQSLNIVVPDMKLMLKEIESGGRS